MTEARESWLAYLRGPLPELPSEEPEQRAEPEDQVGAVNAAVS